MNDKFLAYRVGEKINQGTLSVLNHGYDNERSRPVILKFLKNDHPAPEEIIAFRREYKILSSLDINGVPAAYALEQSDNTFAIILEGFQGKPLRTILEKKERKLALRDFLTISIKISEILGEIHKHSIIHKDINPKNILFNETTKEVKVINFNRAVVLAGDNAGTVSSGILEGTLHYLSPEQTGRMNRPVDYRSDFYSLGIIFYEMLTGSLPFKGDDVLELVYSHLTKNPLLLNKLRPKVPVVISNIVMKLMAKMPEDRYQSAFGLVSDLKKCRRQIDKNEVIEEFEVGRDDVPARFSIPGKLYGREEEIKTMIDTFNWASRGHAELLLITGNAGIGKTSLVSELYKPVVEKRGYFLSGKFEQMKRNIPYSSMIQVFQGFVKQLLIESDEKLRSLKEELLNILNKNGRIITDVIPEVELIIGPQPRVPDLPPQETQNRFNLLFRDFVCAFASQNHPLIIFLDDLHWADTASLNLLEVFLTGADTKYILFIGAFRDNEVDDLHPLMLMLARIKFAGAAVHTLCLEELQNSDVCRLISAALSCSLPEAKLLAELCRKKTGGNPLFLKELLTFCHKEGLINFDDKIGKWLWDTAEIEKAGISDNVVELMTGKIRGLPEQTQQIIKLASCIGSRFDLHTLSAVYGKKTDETMDSLWPTLREQLILPLDESYKLFLDGSDLETRALYIPGSIEAFKQGKESYFRFSHDRLHQAAYALIHEVEKEKIHLKTGQFLLQSTPPEHLEEKIFVILNQLNAGSKLLTAQPGRDELARLNLTGGKKAKTSTAYRQALRYFQQGLRLLSSDSWQRKYDLTLSLHIEAAEAAYLSGDFQLMDKLAQVVLKNAGNLADKVKVYEILIESYLAQNNPLKSMQVGIKALRLLGVRLPKKTGKFHVLFAHLKTKLVMSGKKVEDLILLPEKNDKNTLLLMRIFTRIISSAYMVQPELFALIAIKMVDLSLKYGNSYVSGYAYITYAVFLCGKAGDIEAGYRFGRMVLNLITRIDAREFKARTMLSFGHFVQHWKEPVRNSLKTFSSSYQAGLEIGDLEFACWAMEFTSTFSFLAGTKLTALESEMRSHIDVISKLKQEIPILQLKMFRQAVLNLMEESGTPEILSGSSFDERLILPGLIQADDRLNLFFLYFNKLFLDLWFGRYTEAVEASNRIKKYLESMMATLYYSLVYFYDSLARLAIYLDAPKSNRKAIFKIVTKNREKLKKWAGHAPMNYLNKFYLVEAECCRVKNRHLEAADYYDRSIQSAKEEGFLHEEALANELAGQYYFSLNKERIARIYLWEAYNCYRRWGAAAKTRDMENRYPHLLTGEERQNRENKNIKLKKPLSLLTKSSSSINLKSLDLSTILKATQAISGEIVLSRLLEKMMRIIIENAGADRGFFLLENSGKLQVEAEVPGHGEEMKILQSTPLGEAKNLSPEIINYSVRTKEIVVLDDAVHEGRFKETAYILENKPKSILCLPLIHQDKLTGILYLENNLVTYAFTRERIDVLETLSTQAAISIDNALLYEKLEFSKEELQKHRDHLEELVDERTFELVERNHELEIINRVVQTINREIELKKLLESLLEQAFGLFSQAEMGSFLIYNNEKKVFRAAAVAGIEIPGIKDISFTYREALSRYTEGTEQLEEGVYIVRKFKGIAGEDKVGELPVPKSLLAMTIIIDGEPEGFLLLENMTDPEAFDNSDVRKLLRFREHAVSAFSRARTFKLLNRALEETRAAHKTIKEKNLAITDSIRYAERIQKAILPEDKKIKALLKNYFIIFAPKDIVSGDFYWINRAGDRLLLAAVDCTGHGVPGALLSMIGNMLLDDIVGRGKKVSPALILEELHIHIRKILKQDDEYLNPRDGMEVCLCMLESKKKKLTFAGAKRPLYLFRKGNAELIEIKGDRRPIGGIQREHKRTFSDREIVVETGDVMYLTSDGFVDQNNKEGKKVGSKKLKELLGSSGHLSMKEQKERLLKALLQHQGEEEQRDDIMLVGVEI